MSKGMVGIKKQTNRQRAEAEVLRVRGSWDAPGFEACVKAVMSVAKEQKPKTYWAVFVDGKIDLLDGSPALFTTKREAKDWDWPPLDIRRVTITEVKK